MIPIIGFDGLYSISTDGSITSHPKWKGTHYSKEKVLSTFVDKDGYVNVRLYKDTKCSTKKVHRLVAEHFIDNTKTHLEVNHINGVKDNNSISNLEWCTGFENKIHAVNTGLRKKKLSIDDESEICEAFATGMFTKVELAKYNNVSDATIGTLIKRNA